MINFLCFSNSKLLNYFFLHLPSKKKQMHTIKSLFNQTIDRLAGNYPVESIGRCMYFYKKER